MESGRQVNDRYPRGLCWETEADSRSKYLLTDVRGSDRAGCSNRLKQAVAGCLYGLHLQFPVTAQVRKLRASDVGLHDLYRCCPGSRNAYAQHLCTLTVGLWKG